MNSIQFVAQWIPGLESATESEGSHGWEPVHRIRGPLFGGGLLFKRPAFSFSGVGNPTEDFESRYRMNPSVKFSAIRVCIARFPKMVEA